MVIIALIAIFSVVFFFSLYYVLLLASAKYMRGYLSTHKLQAVQDIESTADKVMKKVIKFEVKAERLSEEVSAYRDSADTIHEMVMKDMSRLDTPEIAKTSPEVTPTALELETLPSNEGASDFFNDALFPEPSEVSGHALIEQSVEAEPDGPTQPVTAGPDNCQDNADAEKNKRVSKTRKICGLINGFSIDCYADRKWIHA